MAKKLKLEHDEQSKGYDYFQNLPDDLVISIFTKLSSNNDNQKYESLSDLKALGRCSSISKRFNSLFSLVPSLSIKEPSIAMLGIDG
ncbi:hypothetical protein DCAR_0206614 [Daucus carota subsp. sativus]|uniref:F-box domain-containing protein n=1 Tax=Daucus carota subsp. sativus TaxID=79200 RepID=A0AAF1APB5_DAUCS|nr:hypothetical protein DCAR_0206614 [Daucus carota subsp. sativus]